MPPTPSTDPDERLSRIRLLPQVVTPSRLRGRLPYPLQRTWRAVLALCPGRVLLSQIPFGRALSLRPLRCRLPGVVRGLHRYNGPVRLPLSVHRRLTSLDFPTRPSACSASGGQRISRFSCEVFPCMRGVSDRAGPRSISRWRCPECCLPLLSKASAFLEESFFAAQYLPACAPVNASTPPSQTAPHDSGSVRVATPSPCDSLIHCTSPVYPGAPIGNTSHDSPSATSHHRLSVTRRP